MLTSVPKAGITKLVSILVLLVQRCYHHALLAPILKQLEKQSVKNAVQVIYQSILLQQTQCTVWTSLSATHLLDYMLTRL